jgi:hypothetical protein
MRFLAHTESHLTNILIEKLLVIHLVKKSFILYVANPKVHKSSRITLEDVASTVKDNEVCPYAPVCVSTLQYKYDAIIPTGSSSGTNDTVMCTVGE